MADTIRDLDEDSERGNGFSFHAFDVSDFLGAVDRALEHYEDEEGHGTCYLDFGS